MNRNTGMRHRLAFTAGLLAMTILAGSATAADISGKVIFTGTPKKEITIRMDALCGRLQKSPITTRHYRMGKDKGIGDVFVYIKEGAKKTPPSGPAPFIDQVNCMYEPYIWGVVAGQEFTVKNSDPVLHNVHATPKVNKGFNFGQPLKGQTNKKKFDKPEVLIRIKCDVHPWMFTYAGVLDHPYFAVTDVDGNFKIPNLPAGTYTLEAYHRKAGVKTAEFTVGADEKKTVNFTLTGKK